MHRMTRRQFLRLSGAAAAGLALFGAGCTPAAGEPGRRTPPEPTGGQAYLSVARGGDPAAITEAAIAALGGIERFVKPGDDVIIKPNICVNYRTPEYAATTNPTVVATLFTMCQGTGAGRVRVMDTPFPGITPESAYAESGIEEAVKAVGGVMEVMSPVKFVKTAIPDGRDITEWEVYQDILDANVLINVPIAKHHSLAGLSLGGKNLLGVITDPNKIHQNLGQRVADLVSLVRPTGGSLNDVQQMDTVIASHDIVAADAYAATLFGRTGSDIAYVRAAADMGLGVLDLDSVTVEEIDVE
jgi:uncharacterized protein (DUF362 family)